VQNAFRITSNPKSFIFIDKIISYPQKIVNNPDKNIEKRIKEIVTDVVTDLFRVLWQRKSSYESELKR
jgi:hypothetical protein